MSDQQDKSYATALAYDGDGDTLLIRADGRGNVIMGPFGAPATITVLQWQCAHCDWPTRDSDRYCTECGSGSFRRVGT